MPLFRFETRTPFGQILSSNSKVEQRGSMIYLLPLYVSFKVEGGVSGYAIAAANPGRGQSF